MRLLLLSNSIIHGRGYMDHAIEAVRAHLAGVRRLAFIPYALKDHAGYGATVAGRLSEIGIEVDTLPADPGAAARMASAEAIFVGGGNTFRLIDHLQRLGLVEAIRSRVRGGVPYMGSSAGSVIAAPTIRTTNDMPIVQPASFEALSLVRFQINAHYLDPDPASTHMGETRELRLQEFHEENETPVVGLREGSWLEVSDRRVILRGEKAARIFRRGAEPEELPPGADLSALNAE